ncbi:MAG TPA: helix-turn-helix domain-containing protein [Pseudoclavibacter sp.]|nr:helix-turn-helix domain-containing protein [Pseudoclavibacter sp.]
MAEYQAGQTMKQIAAKHGIHRVTVSEVLDRTGTAKRPKGMSQSQVDMAARLYESGLSLARVGAQLGFDAATIRTMLLRNGIGTRDSHGREK